MPANFKRLNVSDNFVIPYVANKFWNILSSSFDEKRVKTNVGVNHGDTLFKPSTEYFTNNQYDRLVYNSVNLVYYPNFLPTQSSTASLQNTFYNDGTLSTSSYYNGHVDLGNLDTIKFFPTASGSVIYALNIPKELTSNKILPTTFEITFNSGSNYTASIYDDGNYNLFYSGSNVTSSIGTILSQSSYVGNVFYEQNIAILTIVPNTIRLTGWRGNFPYCLDTNCANQAFDLATQDLDDITTQQLDDLILQQIIGCSPSVTPTVTPTITLTPTVTPSETLSLTTTPSITPSVTTTPTITQTPTLTPSITPTITPSETPSVTITPTVTPTLTPTPSPSNVSIYIYAEQIVGDDIVLTAWISSGTVLDTLTIAASVDVFTDLTCTTSIPGGPFITPILTIPSGTTSGTFISSIGFVNAPSAQTLKVTYLDIDGNNITTSPQTLNINSTNYEIYGFDLCTGV